MKKLFLVLILTLPFILASNVYAESTLSFQTTVPTPALRMTDFTLVPTTPPTCATMADRGKAYYDETLNQVRVCDGTQWMAIDGLWNKTGTVIHPVDPTDFLGVGTSVHEFPLTLGDQTTTQDGSIISHGEFGQGESLASTGVGTRFIVYHKKGAIRYMTTTGYGPYSGGEMDDANIGNYTTVSGGRDNVASAELATVAGGVANTASGFYNFVGGGTTNNANGWATATIAGGQQNTTSQLGAFIGGGGGNNVTTIYGVISGGLNNDVFGNIATVAGGWVNVASGHVATVGGGEGNTASGYASTIAGGESNTVSGSWSQSGGAYMQVTGNRSFGFGHGTSASPVVVSSDNVAVFPTSRMGVGTASPNANYRLDVNGKIGGTLDGTNSGEIKVTYTGSGATAGYYAVYAP